MKRFAVITLLILTLASCDKEVKQALKTIDGTWQIETVTTGGQVDERTFDGNYVFDSCKRRTNKKEWCDGSFNYTITYMGVSETANSNFRYKILEDAERIVLDDSEFTLDLTDTKLTLTSVDADPVVVITMKK